MAPTRMLTSLVGCGRQHVPAHDTRLRAGVEGEPGRARRRTRRTRTPGSSTPRSASSTLKPASCSRPTPQVPRRQEVRALLVGRRLLRAELRDVELSIRDILHGFGLKVGEVSKGWFAARIEELVRWT